LAQIPGVGETTARVIAEALSGTTPTYLLELEQRGGPAFSEAATELRSVLRGDCHSHSDWSDGGSPVRVMAEAAASLGHAYLAMTDHSPRLTIANGLTAERLHQQLDLVVQLNAELAPFRILTGIEVDILEDGTLDQEEDLLDRLDVVVASVHSKLRMESPEMTRRMVRAIENPHSDILGHCTGRIVVGRGRKPSTFEPETVFAACARTGTAVEINSRPERRDPPPELLRLAVGAGCYVSIDTDAHAPGQLEWIGLGCEQAAEAGVDPAKVVNSWDADRLLAWTASHGS
jgi:putative hydrolase